MRSGSETRAPAKGPRLQFRWAETISDEEWAVYRSAIEAVRASGIGFMLGGGFALAAFTGRWRDTKDIDFYIKADDREDAIAALTKAGFQDYFDRLPYDRKWIYRAVRSDVIVDLIWSMANQRAQVDQSWLGRAGTVSIRSQELRVISREDFLWCKIYILQRDHCDWTDIFNLLYACGPDLDWAHIIERLQDDTPLLQALLTVYGWLCPQRARRLPQSLWRSLKMPILPGQPGRMKRDRIHLLDTRDWFAASRPDGATLEV